MFIATAITLIVIIIVVAVAVSYYSGSESVNFTVKGNINPPYNQAMIVLQYKGLWIGGYAFIDQAGERYSMQELNGTENMQTIVNRPNNTIPWEMIVWVQGSRVHSFLTLSIYLTNGTLIDTVSQETSCPDSILSQLQLIWRT